MSNGALQKKQAELLVSAYSSSTHMRGEVNKLAEQGFDASIV